MKKIDCPQCQTIKISVNEVCEVCGYKYEYESPVLDSSHAKTSNIKIAAIFTIGIILLCGLFFGYKFYQNEVEERRIAEELRIINLEKKKHAAIEKEKQITIEKAEKKQLEETKAFAEKARSISNDMVVMAATSEKVIKAISGMWKTSIYNNKPGKKLDINKIIKMTMSIYKKDIEFIKDTSRYIGLRLRGLTPPKGKESDHQKLKDLYIIFTDYADMATRPSGTFRSYTEKKNNLTAKVSTGIKELGMM